MKNFMLIFIGEDYADLNFSPEEMQRRMNKWKEWTQQMIESGIFVDGQGLLKNAKTLKSGPEDIHDGPYLDIKETVGGYYVVKVKDMDAFWLGFLKEQDFYDLNYSDLFTELWLQNRPVTKMQARQFIQHLGPHSDPVGVKIPR